MLLLFLCADDDMILLIVGYRNCSVNINEFRDGQRHDMWLSLENVKLGRLRLAITVIAPDGKVFMLANLAN